MKTMQIGDIKLYIHKKVGEDQFKSIVDVEINQEKLNTIKEILGGN